jgi:predicted short-subunit dehydrogenase-like oxidoreductase (DUF2520 family)
MQVMMSDIYTVNVIGCGKVSKTLAALIHQLGAGKIQDLYSRTPASAYAAMKFIGAGRVSEDLASMHEADIWIIAVPDSQISSVGTSLAMASEKIAAPLLEMPVAFHCSGFESSALLEPLRAKGYGIASLHPVMSFADPRLSMKNFKGTPCAIEGDPRSAGILGKWIGQIGAKAFELSADKKVLYHAAAVFSSNLNVVLQAIALEAWQASGVRQNMIAELHAALLNVTTQNVLHMGPAQALTGPAARGDERVVRLQQDIVTQWHPEAGLVYGLLSALASRLASTGKITSIEADSQRKTPF